MLNCSVSPWLGITFVLVGAVKVCLMLQGSARVRDTSARAGLVADHRIGGYLFIALFFVMGYVMVARLDDLAGGARHSIMIHLTLAMILSPLPFVQVLAARYYKIYHSLLMPTGLVVFVLVVPMALVALERGDARRIEARFVAPCCWHENLAVHNSPAADQMRAEIAMLVASGRTETEIVDHYVARYGERILREPRGQRWLWLTLTPVFVLGCASAQLLLFLWRVKNSNHDQESLAPPTTTTARVRPFSGTT